MESKRLTLKENFIVLIWLAKSSLKFDKTIYILLNLAVILQNNVPIINTYLAALIINKLTENTRGIDGQLLILIVGVLFINFTLNYLNDLKGYLTTRFVQIWELKAWELFLRKTSQLDFQHLESPEYSILMHKVKEAVNWRGGVASQTIPDLLSSILGVVLMITIFSTLNPIFILLILIPETLRFIITKRFGFDLYSIWDSHGEAKHHAWYAQHSLEHEDVIREAKIYSFTESILNRYKMEVLRFMKETTIKLKKRHLLMGGASIIDSASFIVIQVWLITQVLNRSISLGSFTFYLANINSASQAFNTIQNSFSSLLEQLPYVSDWKEYLDLKDIVIKPENPISLQQVAPKIEFKNVSFKYPNSDKYVVKNLDFTMEPGEKVALVGENGAGKTTIIKLLARFYDVTEGEILINGINIKELSLPSYYKLWGVLFQSFAKMWFTVRENIGIGNIEDIDKLELIKEAARKADAEGFINELKLNYETLLSKDFKDGTDLSGGQWQKLGIARSMFANPRLIVLDEPTSALDALAEAEVFDNIKKLSEDSTVIVISHRFATVRNANKILVLENGSMLEQGSHEELIERDGLYKKMFTKQAEGYK